MASADSLPPLYATWMDELLGAEIPPERNATCSDCAMLVSDADVLAGEPGYNAATKCCTFVPTMWNFLVGRVLLDDDPAAKRGRATLEARLDAGIAVTPLGLRRTARYELLYTQNHALFGQSEAMRCPHYLADSGGQCGVWRHRESTCSTWFCKFERGDVRREGTLAGPRARVLSLVYRGRASVHLERCHIARWCQGGAVHADGTTRSREAHQRCGPDAANHRARADDAARSTGAPATYSRSDVLEVPAVVKTLLPYFDGRPIGDALALIAEREGVSVDEAFVRKLTDFDVLFAGCQAWRTTHGQLLETAGRGMIARSYQRQDAGQQRTPRV